jgi:hypothetical protein
MTVASRHRNRLPLTRAAKLRVAEEKAAKKKPKRFEGLSPNSQRHEKRYLDFCADEAYCELLKLRARNGGKPRFKDIQMIVDSYNKSNKRANIERWHLEYRIKMAKKGKKVKGPKQQPWPPNVDLQQQQPETVPTPNIDPTEETPVKTVHFNPDEPTQISEITKATTDTNSSAVTEGTLYDCNAASDEEFSEEEEEEEIQILDSTTTEGEITTATVVTKRKGGRPKDSSQGAKDDREARRKQALTVAATRCLAAKNLAKKNKQRAVEAGLYRQIVKDTAIEYRVPLKKISYQTIKSRVFANNPQGISYQKMSPLFLIEPMLSDILVLLARIGEAQTKYQVFDFANDLIRKTVHQDAYVRFCEARQITKEWEKSIVGERWYRNFMNRFAHKIKRSKFKVQDNNRRTYCTLDNFSNMYDAVYENMVEAGVANRLDNEVMFDKEGNIT